MEELRSGTFQRLYGYEFVVGTRNNYTIINSRELEEIEELSKKALRDIWDLPKLPKREPRVYPNTQVPPGLGMFKYLLQAKYDLQQARELPGMKEFLARLEQLDTKLTEPPWSHRKPIGLHSSL